MSFINYYRKTDSSIAQSVSSAKIINKTSDKNTKLSEAK